MLSKEQLAKLKRNAGAAKQWLSELYECIDRTRTLGLAAETAFWLFLSLLPLLAIAGLIAARLSLENWREVTPIIESFPPAARELISAELVKVSQWDEGTIGVAGSLTFLWLASSGVHAIFEALQIETGAHRPWLRQRLIAFAACIMLSLSVAVLAILGPGIEAALSEVGQGLSFLPNLTEHVSTSRVTRGLIAVVVLVGQVSGLYWLGIPAKARARMPLWPGVLVTFGLQLILSLGYSAYLAAAGDGAAYTAGLTVLGLVLTALYLFVLALLIGAVVNRMLGGFGPHCDEQHCDE